MRSPQSRAGVYVKLARSPLSFENVSAAFKPLGLPDLLTASLEGLTASLVESASLSVRVTLSPGPFELPISTGRACLLEVPSGCTLELEAVVSESPSAENAEPVISRLEGVFSRPILLRNVLTTLSELHGIFEDRSMSRVRAGVLRSGRWLSEKVSGSRGRVSKHLGTVTALAKRAPSALNVARAFLEVGREAVEEYTGGISLQSFSAHPVKRNDTWELQFFFSGEVIVNDFVRIPFERVRLLSAVLPTLHASLSALSSGSPLASGELFLGRIPQRQLSDALVALFASLEGEFSFTGQIPQSSLCAPSFDRGTVVARLNAREALRVSGKLVGDRRERLVLLRIDELELQMGESSLSAVVTAELNSEELQRLAFAEVSSAVLAPSAEAVSEASPCAPRPPRQTLRVAIPSGESARLSSDAMVLRVNIKKGSALDGLELEFDIDHPVGAGSTHLRAALPRTQLSGLVEAYFDASQRLLVPSLLELQCAGPLRVLEESRLSLDAHFIEVHQCEATFDAELAWKARQPLSLRVGTQARFDAQSTTHIAPFPELSILRGELLSQLRGALELEASVRIEAQEGGSFLVDFAGSRASLNLGELQARLGDRDFEIAKGARVSLHLDNAYLFSDGIGELGMVVAWDLQSMPMMSFEQLRLPLLPEEMLRMVLRAKVSPSGELTLSGDRGKLYDARFLNALLHPMEEQSKWLEILAAPSAMALLLPILESFSERLGRWARELEVLLRRARRVLDEEKIEKPGDFIPRARMARVLSRVLFDDLEHENAIAEIVRGVTEANGLDRRAVQALIDELIPEHELEFDLDRLLRWLDHVLSPLVLPPPVPCELLALVDDPSLARAREGLPSAAQLYQMVAPKATPTAVQEQALGRCAAFLTREQLDFLMAAAKGRFSGALMARLGYVASLKKRVELIAEGFGGIAFAPQPIAISFFLADVIEADERQRSLSAVAFPLDGLLGPQEIAALLKTGLVKASPNKLVQVNQHLLFDFMLRRGQDYTLGVLAELGLNCARVLTGVLLAMLNQEQELVRQPVDRVAKLSDLLGIEVPRRDDYMAGGRWARESYFQALMRCAERIIELARPYWARKLHLQRVRHLPKPALESINYERLAKEARRAIDYADSVGETCRFAEQVQGPIDVARRAYAEAFEACARCLDAKPLAFHEPWLKHFWARNHEALVVRSVLRNVQEGVDKVRPWLARRVKVMRGPHDEEYLGNEQRLLETVVDTLYAYDSDRRALLEDPLLRLLIDPEPGRYEFTIVTAMGVVTEGVRGRELEECFLRLEQQYGVRVLRADTGTAKTLEYNAAKLEEAIRRVDTPYGIVGYSQGCGNALMAESLLLSGTPEQQALLDGLIARNFLFSAINGSAHGAGGNEKFRRAMIEGELFLKYYQAVVSHTAIRHFHNTIHASLESRALTDMLGSVESLSYDGVIKLFRDAQFLDSVPTSQVRGVLDREVLPEALEFLSHVFERQVRSAPHDTQVTVDTAVGHPVWVRNHSAALLAACDMGSRPQICHHWSPLSYTADFITTARDREQFIYDMPKDRHIFPWVEVNARFGRIRRRL